MILRRAFAITGLLGTALLQACAARQSAMPPLPCAPTVVAAAEPAPQAAARVAAELDDLHAAAAAADEARYFGHFAPEGVFLGTDAHERWTVPEFRAYAHPHFAAGKGWTYKPTRRAIAFADGGAVAYFDEDLANATYGVTRGSGVLLRRGDRWLVLQYNLTFTVPNDRARDVVAAIAAPPPLRERHHAAYEDAVKAAEAGDLPRAATLLEALVPDAKAHPEDDVEFWLHNQLTWIAWARGDLSHALAEAEASRIAVVHGTLAAERARSLMLHALWDRAYLLLDAAVDAPTRDRPTKLAEAKRAKADYDALAAEAGDKDGAAVLATYFLVREGRTRDAAAAAAKVDVDKDDDVQDLYVLEMAKALAGDSAGSAHVAARICGAKSYLMKPLIVAARARQHRGCAAR